MKKTGSTLSKADKKVLSEVGTKVKSLRERKKMTVYEVTGDDMPIKTRQHWQDIENGKKNINLTTLFKIAETLEVKVEDLVAGIK